MFQDFDDDGTSECIGFSVSEISVFKTAESDVNLLTGNFSVPEDFLKKFSRYNFDGFCLGVLFTNRAFSGKLFLSSFNDVMNENLSNKKV